MQDKTPSQYSQALLLDASPFHKGFSSFLFSVLKLIFIFLFDLFHLVDSFKYTFLDRRSILLLEKLDVSVDICHHITFLEKLVNVFKHVIVKWTILSTQVLSTVDRINIVEFHLSKVTGPLHPICDIFHFL